MVDDEKPDASGSPARVWAWLRIPLIALAYVLIARFSLAFLVQPERVSPFWPPSGFLLGFLVLTPRRRWPALLLTLFVTNTGANLLVGAPLLVGLGYSVANWVGSLCAVWVLGTFQKEPLTMGRLREVLALLALVAVGSNALTGTLGAAVSAIAFGAPFWSAWRVWWIADSMGVLLVAPVVVSWARAGVATWRRLGPGGIAEGAVLLASMAAVAYLVFGAESGARFFLPLPYATFPFLLWGAIRFGPPGGSLLSLVLAGTAVWFTAHGAGPFAAAGETAAFRVLSVQAFLSVVTLCTLMLAAVIHERQQAEEALRGSHGDLEARIQERTRELSAANQALQSQIVEREEAERKVRQTVTELARSNSELERSNAELAQFAYVASHDLQEPLRAVTGTVQILQQRYRMQVGPETDDLSSHVVDGVSRMKALLDGMLDFSRIGTRGRPFDPCDFPAILEETLFNLARAVEDSGAVVTHGDLPTVRADRSQMVQLLQNLIGNAIKFRGRNRPEIHVEAKRTGGEVRFMVRDNGIGIDPEYFERIFGLFQRLHTRKAYPGTGIGLAICKKIVERHCGRIWVESEPGRGASFFFTLQDPAPAA